VKKDGQKVTEVSFDSLKGEWYCQDGYAHMKRPPPEGSRSRNIVDWRRSMTKDVAGNLVVREYFHSVRSNQAPCSPFSIFIPPTENEEIQWYVYPPVRRE
jgi:hypothetical protein